MILSSRSLQSSQVWPFSSTEFTEQTLHLGPPFVVTTPSSFSEVLASGSPESPLVLLFGARHAVETGESPGLHPFDPGEVLADPLRGQR